MVQSLSQQLTFEAFLQWHPEDGRRFQLIDGHVIEMRPAGDHEELASRITRLFDREIDRLDLPYLIPKSCCVKPLSDQDGYVPDVIVLDRSQLVSEPLWKTASTITRGSSTPLVVEIVSTNWHVDYARKLEDYERLGILEYWIVDYRALGGTRFIGSPKRPTLSLYTLRGNNYGLKRLRGDQLIPSSTFPELRLTADQILQLP